MDLYAFGIGLGLVSSALFALQNVVIKLRSEEINPIAANALKLWISLPLMFGLLFVQSLYAPIVLPMSALLPLGISVFFGAACGDAVYLVSQDRIGVSMAFPITNTYPIFTYFIAFILLGERLLFSRMVGVILAVMGIYLVSRDLYNEQSTNKPTLNLPGMSLALAASLMYAIATVMMQIGVAQTDVLTANTFRLSIGSVLVIPAFAYWHRDSEAFPVRSAVYKVAVAGLFGLAISSLFYVASVKYVGATIASVLGSTAPLFALPFSVYYLKEAVTWRGLLGTAVSIIGVWLAVI